MAMTREERKEALGTLITLVDQHGLRSAEVREHLGQVQERDKDTFDMCLAACLLMDTDIEKPKFWSTLGRELLIAVIMTFVILGLCLTIL